MFVRETRKAERAKK